MSTDYSYSGLIEFLEYASNHGLMKAPTARSYRVAATKVQDELTEQEARDVRNIDLDLVFQRFVNRNKVEVAQKTLRVYRRRLETAIEEYVAWRADPMGYRPQIGSRRARSGEPTPSSKAAKSSARATESTVATEPAAAPAANAGAMLNIPFPLRPDFVASLQVPRDMTAREAGRLAAFVKTLAMDFDDDRQDEGPT